MLAEMYERQKSRWTTANDKIDELGDTMEIRNDKGVVTSVVPSPKLKVVEMAERSMRETLDKIIELRGSAF